MLYAVSNIRGHAPQPFPSPPLPDVRNSVFSHAARFPAQTYTSATVSAGQNLHTYPRALTHTNCAMSAAAGSSWQPVVPHALFFPASSWKVALGQATVLQRLEFTGASSTSGQSPGGTSTGGDVDVAPSLMQRTSLCAQPPPQRAEQGLQGPTCNSTSYAHSKHSVWLPQAHEWAWANQING